MQITTVDIAKNRFRRSHSWLHDDRHPGWRAGKSGADHASSDTIAIWDSIMLPRSTPLVIAPDQVVDVIPQAVAVTTA